MTANILPDWTSAELNRANLNKMNLGIQENSASLEYKLEGFSSKYNIAQTGWHRVLNTIRGNGGQLYLTIANTNYNMQSIVVDMQGFVRYKGASEVDPNFAQRSIFTPCATTSQMDDLFFCRFTKIRIGYPKQDMIGVNPARIDSGSPINCYVDVYIDFDYTSTKQLTCQFTGKSMQHNAYNIVEETTSSNYRAVYDPVNKTPYPEGQGPTQDLTHGLYGEELEFYTVPIITNRQEVAGGSRVLKGDVVVDKLFVRKPATCSESTLSNLGDEPHIADTHGFGSQICYANIYRKYNMLVPGCFYPWKTSNNYFLTWDPFYSVRSTDFPEGDIRGKITRPYQQYNSKTDPGAFKYSLTQAGAVLFSGVAEGGLIRMFTCDQNNSESPYLILTPGVYQTNLKIFKKGSTSAYNSITPTAQNKFPNVTFQVTESIAVWAVQLPLVNGIDYTYSVCCPYLVRVSDDPTETVSPDTISYVHRHRGNFTETADGHPIFTDRFDWIEIHDGRDGSTIIVNDFNSFYSSDRLNYCGTIAPVHDGSVYLDFVDGTVSWYYDSSTFVNDDPDNLANRFLLYSTDTKNSYDSIVLADGGLDVLPLSIDTFRYKEVQFNV